MPIPTLTVANEVQAALFELELKGQISDGMWENVGGDHWMPWSEAEVRVGEPGNLGRNFRAIKDNYAFNSRKLLDVVGNRMLITARFALAGYSKETIRDLVSCFYMGYGVTKVTMEIPSFTGSYYDELRQRMSGYDLSVPELVANDQSYGMKELNNDLRALKKIVRIQLAA